MSNTTTENRLLGGCALLTAGTRIAWELERHKRMSPVDQSLPPSPRWEQHPVLVEWQLAAPRGAGVRKPEWHQLAGGNQELDGSEAERMVRDLAAAGVSVLLLDWEGAALRDDLGALVRLAARDGLETWLRSRAGVGLEPAAAQELADAGLAGFSVRVAADESDGASLAAFSTAEAAGLRLGVETLVDRRTIEQLPAIRASVEKLGAARWHLHYPVSDPAVMPTAEQVEISLQELAATEHELSFSVELTAAPQFQRVRVARGHRGTGSTRALGDGRGLMFVSYCGDIFPSAELPVPCGNLRMHDLLDVYRFHPTFRMLRDPTVLHGRCGGCEYQRACGGSRARAYALEGSLLAGDLLCVHSPQALMRNSFP